MHGSAMTHITRDMLRMLRVSVPTLSHQRAIADYLDTETSRIDTLITKKRRMIELLDERRSATLTAAIFGGLALHDGTTLRSSTKIPDTWIAPSFSHVVQIAAGQVDPRMEPYKSMMLIAPNHIEGGTGVLLTMETAGEQGAISGKYLCNEGDVVYSKIRPALRKVIVAPEQCLTSADMYPLRCSSAVVPRYLAYFLLSEPFSQVAILESDRVAMPKINRDSLKALRILLPPRHQQAEIADRLDREFASISRTVQAIRRQISLMLERRQALITAAVTAELSVA